MNRSYRGLGFVVLMLLVVAPLTLFAVLSLFEDESADSISMSLDGVSWRRSVHGSLLASREPWGPGDSRSVIVYVRNGGPDPVDATVAVRCRSIDQLVSDGHLSLTAQVDQGSPVRLPIGAESGDVRIDGLGSDEVVPLTLVGTLADTAPPGATLDGRSVDLRLTVTGTRTEESGAPSLLDAAGAQLWLAPILLVGAAGIAVLVRTRRAPRPRGTGGTRS